MAAQFGAMVKRMHAGRSSQSGLYGALFAEAGFTGIVNVLESEYGGFCTTLSQSKDQFDLKELTAGLGTTWQTMGVALKFYSCVGSNHTTLDAIREMQAEKPFGAKDVKKIVVHGSKVTMEHVGWKYVPQGLTSAQLNLPYCVATWLLDGDCFVDQFTEAKVADPARMALAEKVEVREDKDITARGAKFRHMVHVEVHLNDGTRDEAHGGSRARQREEIRDRSRDRREIREARGQGAAQGAGGEAARRDAGARETQGRRGDRAADDAQVNRASMNGIVVDT